MNRFTFNIMDATGYGFYRVWGERAYLMRLAMIPLIIKLACTVAVFAFDMQDNFLRQGLIMLPGDFAEGWLLAQFLRTILMEERWPIVFDKMPVGEDMARLLLRARGIVAATLAYVLISMFGNAMMYFMFQFLDGMGLPAETPATPATGASSAVNEAEEPAPSSVLSDVDVIGSLMFIPSVLMILGLIWFFRFLWIYIPFALLMPPIPYLKALGGFMASVRMMMLYFCCMSPIMFVTVVLSRFFYGVFDSGESGDDMPAKFLTLVVGAVAELAVAIVATTAMAWAMRGFLPKSPKAMAEFRENGTRT